MPDVHDLGGKAEHYGPIRHSSGEPVFHERWESRVFGVATFLHPLGIFGPNSDRFRWQIEQLSPEEYAQPYYDHWLRTLETLTRPFVKGERTVSRLKVAGTARMLRHVMGRPTMPRWMNAKVAPRMVGSAKRAKAPGRFAVGDAVRVRPERHDGHTRQPGYVTGKRGRITAHRGAAVFADDHVDTGSTAAAHLYTVAFEGVELWGPKAEPNTEIRIELFEPYLEPA